MALSSVSTGAPRVACSKESACQRQRDKDSVPLIRKTTHATWQVIKPVCCNYGASAQSPSRQRLLSPRAAATEAGALVS